MSVVLHVDLDALAANLAEIRRRVAPALHMLVVKDDAYGHGLEPVVQRAWTEGVKWFGAFDVRTGYIVRAALGPEARIFVWMVGSIDEVRDALHEDLDIGVGDLGLLEDIATARRPAAARVHLKIDTGLHRNGVRPEEWPAFVARAAQLEHDGAIEVVGVWSHIAEASEADDDDAREAFDAALSVARDAGLRPSMRHLAASAAAFDRPEFRYDAVRVGAFAYGIRPAGGPDETELGIRPIARLSASVIETDPVVRIDATSLHGLPSSLGGRVTLGSPSGPRRLIALDTTGGSIEGEGASLVGEEITVYGPSGDGAGSATTLAEAVGTIGEEIALRLSPLVPRVYSD
ncbi:MAG: alanine racemase [Microbacterium sp.]|nr:alanine racemase [Microbacterium sp.]